MTLRIGRVAFGDDERTRVGSLSFSGDTLSLNGEIKAVDQAKASAEMQRINGLIEGKDEPVVPLTWPDGPPDVEGFYRVTGGRVDGVGNYMSNGRAGFDLQLTRVSGFAAPMFEDRVIGGPREGIVAGVTPQAFMALPSSVMGYEIGASLTPNFYSRPSHTGDLTVFVDGANTLFDSTPAFFLAPEDWYDGSSQLQVSGELIVGRQVRNRPLEWEVDNGLIALSGTAGGIVVQRWASGVRADERTIRFYRRIDAGSMNELQDPHTITVLRNSPEEVSVRLTYDADSVIPGARFSVAVDISVRRGSKVAAISLKARGSYRWGVQVLSWGASIATVTGGRYGGGAVLAIDETMGSGLGGSGGIPAGAAYAQAPHGGGFKVGVGYYGEAAGGAGGTAIDTPQAAVNQWAAAQSERIDAVVR